MGSAEEQVLAAAQRGDRVAFAAAAARYGPLTDAHRLVREKAVLRMVDRARTLPDIAGLVAVEGRANDEPDDAADGTTLFGHFAVFNEWTEIDSWFEGRFLERLAPGSFRKTIRENRDHIKALFQHGMDPVVGDKPLGPVEELHEDDTGVFYEVPLLDAAYVRDDVLPGLQAGLYGASFRFQVMREDFQTEPDPSDHNPSGLPERTIKELRLFEFGPVTFPAYPSATAGVRSISQADAAPPPDDAEPDTHHNPERVVAGARPHLVLGRRGNTTITLEHRKDKPPWLL